MRQATYQNLVSLDTKEPIWDHFFVVHPLVVVGTREEDGDYNFAPKHMAMPMGWDNYFGCVCTPSHRTYHNAKREGTFTVTYPRPDQVVLTSLSATTRCEDNSKPILKALRTFPARNGRDKFLEEGYLFLECALDRIIDGFGVNSLIVGRIEAAHVHEDALRQSGYDDNEMIHRSPLLAYLQPGRFAAIGASNAFPFPAQFKR